MVKKNSKYRRKYEARLKRAKRLKAFVQVSSGELTMNKRRPAPVPVLDAIERRS